jgi:hypothetical protein
MHVCYDQESIMVIHHLGIPRHWQDMDNQAAQTLKHVAYNEWWITHLDQAFDHWVTAEWDTRLRSGA